MSQSSETKVNDDPSSRAGSLSSFPGSAFDKVIEARQPCSEVRVRAGDPDSARQFKREVEQEYRAEIRQLREESAAKDRVILLLQSDFIQMKTEFRLYQEANQKPLAAAQAMASALHLSDAEVDALFAEALAVDV
jgi:hypothetical protein